jgi:hypothetical protein
MVGFDGKVVQSHARCVSKFKEKKCYWFLSSRSLWNRAISCCKASISMPRIKVGENYFLKTNVQCVVNENLYFVTGVEIML